MPAKMNPDHDQPSQSDAEQAITTLLAWIGEDPEREGLRDTPARFVRACQEYFAGYREDPAVELSRSFEEIKGYDDFVILRDIAFTSHCEHHIAPIIGVAHVGYIPVNRVVGISKIARVVEIFARRLQTQESMTAQIANSIEQALNPKGVAVVIEAEHFCMTTRGVKKKGVLTLTRQLRGAFRDDPVMRDEWMRLFGQR
ncbi:MAG: GTP cyclohydrolase I FolE [Pseudomonadota bacterium]